MNTKLYQKNIIKAMKMLADKGYIFMGQTCKFSGSPIFCSLSEISDTQKMEIPIIEDTQLGMSIGMSLIGIKVCSVFPRMDFLVHAFPQLINHADKIEEMSHGEFTAPIIIRTQIGNTKPIYPGAQHCGDYTAGLKTMLKHVKVIKIRNENAVIQSYKEALIRAKRGQSTLLVEVPTGAFGGKR